MKVAKAVLALIAVNGVLWVCIFGVFVVAVVDAGAPGIHHYEDWKLVSGRQLFFNATNRPDGALSLMQSAGSVRPCSAVPENFTVLHLYKDAKQEPWRWSSEKPDYPNITFSYSFLRLEVFAESPVRVSFGRHQTLEDIHADVYKKHLDFQEQWYFETDYLQTELESKDRLRYPSTDKYSYWKDGKRHDVYDELSPAIWWNGNATVRVEYVDFWKYTPLESVDFSHRELAENTIQGLVPIVWAVIVSDVIVVAVLLGLRMDENE